MKKNVDKKETGKKVARREVGSKVKKRGENAEKTKKLNKNAEEVKDSKSIAPEEIQRRADLERDLTYAKSEIGTAATSFLKKSPLVRRAAGVVLAVVLSVGAGTLAGHYQIHSLFTGGSGSFGANVEKVDKGDDDTGIDPMVKEMTTKTTAKFTKGEDGVYRWHADAGQPRYQEQWNSEYIFAIPSELRAPSEPYVLHVRVHRRSDITADMKKMAQVDVFSSPKDDKAVNVVCLENVPSGEWASTDVADMYLPFSPKNSGPKEEISMVTLSETGVDVDVEIMPADRASLRTWDGHSVLNSQRGVASELVRVTGPITATTLIKGDRDVVQVYGYRRGDKSFTPLVVSLTKGQTFELSGQMFVGGSTTLDGVEMIWVDGGMRNEEWSIR